MDPPPTQYIDRDGAALAYQVIGDGPPDVVWAFDVGQHLGLVWTDPDIHRVFEEVALFSRSVLMQRRGFGLSDQISYTPTIEQQADDLLAVMDAVGFGAPHSSGTSAHVELLRWWRQAPRSASMLSF